MRILTAVLALLTMIAPASAAEAPRACTMEAKLCPDGSSVGRTGPNCAFAACPVALPVSVTAPPAGKGVPRGAAGLDLAAFGYVEEEFLVSGKANVYQYDAAGAVEIKTPGVDYTTRILVRRPTDSKKFSGTVRFETSHPQYGLDFVWARTTDFLFTNGDAFVSVLMRRGEASAIESTKRFDEARYAPINFTEDGLNWDIIGQVGRLLKTRSDGNPLNAYDVKRTIAQGWSGGGAVLLIYISDGFHDRARMPGGRPIFDGYLVGEPSGYPRINASAPQVANDDPKQKVRAIDVPVISLHTRPQEPGRRRADDDRYRVYEVAGAAHNNRRLPVLTKQSEKDFTGAGCTAEISHFPMHHYFKSTLARLDAWVTRGVKPPPSQRLTLKEDGTPSLDAHGSPAGGVRSSYLDVPTARYFTNAAATGSATTPAATGGGIACPQDGAQEKFPREKLVSLYKTHAGYVDKATRRINELEREGWLLPADAKELREEAKAFGGF